MLKFSIITATYNSAATLEDTIHSVIHQDYPEIEYIIKDGGSTDDTLFIAERYKERIANVISQHDSGIYDALNQGLQASTGDVVGFLHSDDIYVSNEIISKIAEVFVRENCDAVYSDLYYVQRNDKDRIVRKWNSGKYTEGMFLNGWMPPHPTFFVKREVYERYGNFNTEFRTSADYELMLRFVHRWKIRLAYLEDFTVKMRVGGQSNFSLANRFLANKEDRRAWRVNGLRPRFYTLTWKPIRKIFQYF